MSFKEIIRLISERHTDMAEVTDALSDMMHTVKDRLPEVYKETMYCLEEIAYRITPEEARQIVKGMRPYGQKWDYDTIKAFLATKGITAVCKYYLCMNMYYNDSHDTAEMVGRGEDPEFYFSLAKDFINDIDGKDFKVEKYFTA
jgi:hypothetical protein